MENHCRVVREHVHSERRGYGTVKIASTALHGIFKIILFRSQFDNGTMYVIVKLPNYGKEEFIPIHHGEIWLFRKTIFPCKR